MTSFKWLIKKGVTDIKGEIKRIKDIKGEDSWILNKEYFENDFYHQTDEEKGPFVTHITTTI